MLPVGPVLAQTTTSTSTSTSTTSTNAPSTTSSTSTTVGNTTTTALVATVDLDPPGAFLAGTSGEVRGQRGSSCWMSPGSQTGRCVDVAGELTGPTLDVATGEALTLRFTTALALTQLSLRSDGVETPVPQTNPSRFRADLPPGNYQLLVLARFAAGDASYGFGLRVSGPPTAPPAASPVIPPTARPAVPTVAATIKLTG